MTDIDEKEKEKILADGLSLALKHWDYIGKLCEKFFIDAFVHGYKHGRITDLKNIETLIVEMSKKIK